MSAASLIGFGVVLLMVSWLTSAGLALGIGKLARLGPAVERKAATLAAVLPVVLGIAVVATLVVESIIGVDHCDTHGHHAHLCLVHGAAWAERRWAVVLIAGGSALLLWRGVALASSLWRGARMTRQLTSPLVGGAAPVGSGATPVGSGAGEDGVGDMLRVVPSERPFCFVAGMRRPRIFASTAARRALGDEEWRAMLAHEREHITHRDLLHRLGLELLLLLAAPFAASKVRAHWDSATERLRDHDAADRATPEAVASALLCMAKATLQLRASGQAAFMPQAQSELSQRITSLLDRAPRGDGEARRVARFALLAVGGLALLTIAHADPLHHALETLLG